MASTSYTGYAIPGPILTADKIPLYEHDAALRSRTAWTFPPTHVVLAGNIKNGTLNDNQPISEVSTQYNGTELNAFEADYYHRIHVVPNSLDLGNINSTTQQKVEIWNAHFVPRRLDSITHKNTSGLRLTAAKSPPTVYGALESRINTFQILQDGPYDQRARFEFNFAAEVRRLSISLRRMLLWAFGPNWSQPVVERLEWLTDVLPSHANVEQRVRLRENPRRAFEYRILAKDNAERVRIYNRLLAWQGNIYALPIWPQADRLTAPLAAGVSHIALATAGHDYAVNQSAVLINQKKSELLRIKSVTAAGFNTEDPTKYTWPAGTRIIPVAAARISNPLMVNALTDTISDLRANFELAEVLPVKPHPISTKYRNYQVLTARPDWSGDIQERYARKLIDIDYKIGNPLVTDVGRQPIHTRQHRWLLKTRSEINAFRAWLTSVAGRLNPFWMPSFTPDAHLVRGITKHATTLDVAHRDFFSTYNLDGRRDIMLTLNNGQRFFRRITGITNVNDDVERVSINDPFPASVGKDGMQISFMRLARLESDAVEIAYITDQTARVTLNVRSIKEAV